MANAFELTGDEITIEDYCGGSMPALTDQFVLVCTEVYDDGNGNYRIGFKLVPKT